jgi:class 3 adenylate cyclase/predicted ATPase
LNSPEIVVCAECGANFVVANFCGNCGARYRVPEVVREDAEQRYLTVLFCDLVGSTYLTEVLNAEDYHELLTAYQQVATDAMTAYDGYIAQYLGDGVLVYFGYPISHEDDPRRALLASMAMLRGIEALNRNSDYPSLAVRIGVHAGMVVAGKVGAGATKYDLALGLAPNVAARLQSLAEPGRIVISETLHSLVKGFFTFTDMGLQSIRGVSEPMKTYLVEGVDTLSRHQALVAAGLTPFVGRREEVAMLAELWTRAGKGHSPVALILGEGGIGKSRLTRLVADMSLAEHAEVTDCECSPLHSNTTLFPIVEMLNARIFGLATETSSENRLARLERYAERTRLDLQRAVPLIASLLNVPLDDRYAMPNMGPEWLREETLDLLQELIMAAPKPHLIIVEDMQWADATTQELIGRLVRDDSLESVMILLNARPEFVAPWPETAIDYTVELKRLEAEDLATLIGHVAEDGELPEQVAEQILSSSDGVPLFAEELTKAVLDSIREGEAGKSPERLVPESLSASLMARLDRLGSAKEIAQRASILGRRFPFDQLQAIAGVSLKDLNQGLEALIGAGMIHAVGLQSHSVYQFNHVLVQTAAYNSLLRRTRRQLHDKLVECLEHDFPDVVRNQPELLARHSQLAGRLRKSIDYWSQAGRSAFARSANLEAVAHLRSGRSLIDRLADSPDRVGRELTLLTLLGPALIATSGFASDEVGEVYDRARDLCNLASDDPDTFPVLAGSWVFFLVKGDLETSRAYAEDMLRLGEATSDDNLLVQAHYALGNSLYWLGELAASQAHLERANALYDPRRHQDHVLKFGHDPGVTARCYLTFVYWMTGHPDQSWAALDSAVAAAEPLDHPFTTAWPMAFRVIILSHRRETKRALAEAQRLIDYAMEEHQQYWLQAAIIVRGWARACGGEVTRGIRDMRQGIAAYAATGAGVSLPHFHGLVIEVLIAEDRLDEAAAELEIAFEIAKRNGERLAEIGLWRLGAELAAARGDRKAAIENGWRATKLAEETGAWGLGLRASVCLHRLLEGATESPLPAFVARFPDSDMPDLREAISLLKAD